MAAPNRTPQEELDFYQFIRSIAWRLKLDEAENLLVEDIQRIVEEARADIERGLLRLDPDKLTPEAVARVMGEARVAAAVEAEAGEKQRVPIREALIAGIAAVAGGVFAASLDEYFNALSADRTAAKIRPVAVAAATPKDLAALFRGTPLNGRTLPQWVDSAMGAGFESVVRAMNEGIAKGESYRQIVRRIMTEVRTATEREATIVARTYVQSVAVAAQEAVYEANADVIKELEWTATLEPGYKQTGRGTCIRCQALDGMRWRVMDKNRPDMPLHFVCRCVWTPIMDWEAMGVPNLDFGAAVRPYTIRVNENIGTGGTREILEGGRTRGSWGQWAATRDDALKINAIGPYRVEMWKRSGLPFDEFMHSLVDRKTGELLLLPELETRIRRMGNK